MKAANLLVATLMLFAASASYANGKIELEDAWIRQPAPGMAMTAGYMKVKNGTSGAVAITGARSKDFGRIELHRTEITDGMARMIPQQKVDVPAGGEVMFMPKGLHLMMFDPKVALKPGTRVMVELQLQNHKPVTAHFTVRGADGGAMEHHDGEHMKH